MFVLKEVLIPSWCLPAVISFDTQPVTLRKFVQCKFIVFLRLNCPILRTERRWCNYWMNYVAFKIVKECSKLLTAQSDICANMFHLNISHTVSLITNLIEYHTRMRNLFRESLVDRLLGTFCDLCPSPLSSSAFDAVIGYIEDIIIGINLFFFLNVSFLCWFFQLLIVKNDFSYIGNHVANLCG